MDLTDDEIISIEDTYKETNVGGKREEEEEAKGMHCGNKSMTIIEEDEDEYEDSSMLNN